ncbi:MAG: hypothetical protein A2V67_06725 [Deltaproteobacteria bacterium RBG_13_61_14]|nr:MAG: hypothetical protein A2V67_06725 [Deltaproteobacteria bacterium RBG_13_61_14]
MTNNELSRKVIALLAERKKPVKFQEMVEAISVDARTLFKNLFYLEEHGYILLSTSYPPEAIYPQIHFARLRDPGLELAKDPGKLDEAFPLTDTARDHAPHLPPDLPARKKVTYAEVLERLAEEVKAHARDKAKQKRLLQKIADLKKLALAKRPVSL